MKRLYWRPRQISKRGLILVALISLVGLTGVENFRLRTEQPYYKKKIAASRLALEGFRVLQKERLRRNTVLDPATDPMGSGLIGSLITPVTSNTGVLSAKQTSINPNFAAVVVQLLKRAGVQEGDTVAVGFSGSFPALNICVLSAIQTLNLNPVIISSASASQWGANEPDLLWIDMERILAERRVFRIRSVAASPGGIEDRALGMSRAGRNLLYEAIERNGLERLRPKSYTESVEQHMALYEEKAGGSPIRVYINVGGGTTSVGTRVGKHSFQPGLNLKPPAGVSQIDSVMMRFSSNGVPVIHLVYIEKLARTYGLPLQPHKMPEVGEGKIFFREEYNRWLAALILIAIVASLYALIRSELGYRLLYGVGRQRRNTPPEPML